MPRSASGRHSIGLSQQGLEAGLGVRISFIMPMLGRTPCDLYYVQFLESSKTFGILSSHAVHAKDVDELVGSDD
jgi:hypothetical protein